MHALLLLGAMLLLATRVAADPQIPRKKAWEWTFEERVAMRLDPDRIRARAAALEGESAFKDGSVPPERLIVGPVEFTIDGHRNPELFLPWELFRRLSGHVHEHELLPDDRQRFGKAIRDAGWDEDAFWKTLAGATAQHHRVHKERIELEGRARTAPPVERRELEARIETLNYLGCAMRADAFAIVQEKLGAERLNRFLYEHVAPSISIGSRIPDGTEAWRLRWIAGGCR